MFPTRLLKLWRDLFSHTTGLAPRNAVEQKLLEIATGSSLTLPHAVGGPLLPLPNMAAGGKVEGKQRIILGSCTKNYSHALSFCALHVLCVGGRERGRPLRIMPS